MAPSALRPLAEPAPLAPSNQEPKAEKTGWRKWAGMVCSLFAQLFSYLYEKGKQLLLFRM